MSYMLREGRRAAVCSVALARLLESGYSYGGEGTDLWVSARWENVRFSSVEYEDERQRDGGLWKIRFSVSVTDNSQATRRLVEDYTGCHVLVRLGYTDGTFRVLGAGPSSVSLQYRRKGRPVVHTLFFEGESVFPAREFKSF